MGRWLTALVVATVAFGVSAASAQETTGTARWEITGFPGGGILFTEGSSDSNEADFGNYALGGSLTYNFHTYWGVEGEFGGALGIDQRIGFANGPSIGDTSPPDMLAYHGNALFYPLKNDRRQADGENVGIAKFGTRGRPPADRAPGLARRGRTRAGVGAANEAGAGYDTYQRA